jgi:hypothetical protein
MELLGGLNRDQQGRIFSKKSALSGSGTPLHTP